jgi:hypothetical protein
MAVDRTADALLNELLDELELRAQQQHLGERSDEYWVCQRKYPRNPFRAACLVHFFPQGSSTVANLSGRTRNLSRSGVGLIVRRVFRAGEPVEVELLVPERPRMYLAGLVTFCRYAGHGYHEVGVALRAAGPDPVFSRDPIRALHEFEWLRFEPPVER